MKLPEGKLTTLEDLKEGDKLQYVVLSETAPTLTSPVLEILMVEKTIGWIWFDYDEGRHPVVHDDSMKYFVLKAA